MVFISCRGLAALAMWSIHLTSLVDSKELKYGKRTFESQKYRQSTFPPNDKNLHKHWTWTNTSHQGSRLLRSKQKWEYLQGWWWSGFNKDIEKPNLNRAPTAQLGLPEDAEIGLRYVARCVYYRNLYTVSEANDGFRRVGPEDSRILIGTKNNSTNISCSGRGALTSTEIGVLEAAHRALAQERFLIRFSREHAVSFAAASMQPSKKHFYQILGTSERECLDKGLTHKLNNLEVEIQLSWFLNRTFVLGPLLEHPHHSSCRNITELPWSYLMDFSGIPVVVGKVTQCALSNASKCAPSKVDLTWAPEDLADMRRISADPNLTTLHINPANYTPILKGKKRKLFPWCTHYSRGMTWDAFFLPWSTSVLNAANSIAQAMTGRAMKRHDVGSSDGGSDARDHAESKNRKDSNRSSENPHHEAGVKLAKVSSFDGVHFRSGDKTGCTDAFVALPSINSDELFCRTYAHLARPTLSSSVGIQRSPLYNSSAASVAAVAPSIIGGRATTISSESRLNSKADSLGTSLHLQSRPLYVATDSPAVLRRGRGAVAIRHVWPHLYTAEDFTGLLARHCTEPQLYDPARACAHLTPFFTLAAEMALLESAERFVSSERSSPSRRISLKRHVAGQQRFDRFADISISNASRYPSKFSDSVRYLYSSQVLHLTSATTNVAEWERATLRGDEAAVLVRDAAASDNTVQRFETCADNFAEASRCMRAHGFALAASMAVLSAAATAAARAAAPTTSATHSNLRNDFITTVHDCCQLCQAARDLDDGTEGSCTAFQWETNHTLHRNRGRRSRSTRSHPRTHSNTGDAAAAEAARQDKEEPVMGRCVLRTGEIEIRPVQTSLKKNKL